MILHIALIFVTIKLMPEKGSTLVELLIAVTIIAILTVIGLTAYSSVQKSARDTRRKDDLHSIKVALELYYQRNKEYPKTDWVVSDPAQPSWIPGLSPDYIAKVPTDILNKDQDPRFTENQYGYTYWSQVCGTILAGQLFVLITQLENKNDSQRNQLQKYKTVCGENTLTTDPGLSPYAFVITSE